MWDEKQPPQPGNKKRFFYEKAIESLKDKDLPLEDWRRLVSHAMEEGITRWSVTDERVDALEKKVFAPRKDPEELDEDIKHYIDRRLVEHQQETHRILAQIHPGVRSVHHLIVIGGVLAGTTLGGFVAELLRSFFFG